MEFARYGNFLVPREVCTHTDNTRAIDTDTKTMRIMDMTEYK